ncbi:UbiA family prenyltransferase [Sphingobium sp. H33]|uniref:UbiA family prenyltransferase n=2 Tax=Sphingobium nicotianae TaxID=2782607 RepID=A0A9X1DDJ4_9SPHN|nr:UbiA family prenyltransferase [Sphingobium nicotianae]
MTGDTEQGAPAIRPQASTVAGEVPLCVDLDGTLARTDLLHEAAVRYIKQSPFALFHLLIWLLHGKAYLKQRLAERVVLRGDLLPYRADLVEFLRDERARGREIHLVTASPQAWADMVAAHLGLFDGATGSGTENYKGRRKASLLVERHGEGGYDYIGDHAADFPIWLTARTAHFAGRRGRIHSARVKGATVGQHFDVGERSRLRGLVKAARPHQWSKNLLLFVSITAAHQLFDFAALGRVVLAFVSFSLMASATYMINDMLDLDTDRAHPRKSRRPFASGAVGIADGIVAIALLSGIAIGIAVVLGAPFVVSLGVYVATTLAYSFRLKRAALVDVITLAGLYTLRIVAGTIAAAIPISSWLLAFAMFCFITLAIAKRCAELTGTQVSLDNKIAGRGYYGADIEVLAGMGSASTFCASLVLCIYTTQPYVATRYASPEILWLLCPILIYLLSRILILARRGHMDDDPIVFCVKDKITLKLVGISALVLVAAAYIHLPLKLIADV